MGKKHWNEPWNGGGEIRPGIPRLRGLTESLPVAAMVADPLGSPLVVNDRFRTLLGDPPAEGWLSLVEPAERASAESVWLLAGIARATREVDLGFVGAAGPFRATCRIAPVEEEGRVLGWAITLAEAAPDLSTSLEQAVAGLSEAQERLRGADERRLDLEDQLAAAEMRLREVEDQAARAEGRRHEVEGMLEAAEQRHRQIEELLAVSESARLEVEDRLAETEARLHGLTDRLAEADARRNVAEAQLAGVEAARREVEDRLAEAEAGRREVAERLVDSEAQRRELADLLADSEARASEAAARVALADAHRRDAETREAEAESRLGQAMTLLTEAEERRGAAEEAAIRAQADRDNAMADRDEARALAEGWAEAAADTEARLADALARVEAAKALEATSGSAPTLGAAPGLGLGAGSDESVGTPGDEPAASAWAPEPFGPFLAAAENHDALAFREPAGTAVEADTAVVVSDMSRAFAAMERVDGAEEPEMAGVVALGETAAPAAAGDAGAEEATDRPELAVPVPDWQLVAGAHLDAAAVPPSEAEVADPATAVGADADATVGMASEAPDSADGAADGPGPATGDDHGDVASAGVARVDAGDLPEEVAAAHDAETMTAPEEQAPVAEAGQGDAVAAVGAEGEGPAEHAEEPAGILEPDDGPELDQLAARLRSEPLRAALGRWRAGRGRSGVPSFQAWDEASTGAGQVVIEMDEAGVPVRLRVVRPLEETPLLRALSAPPGGEGHGWRRCAASGRPAHDYAEVGLGPEGGHSLERLLLPFTTHGTGVDRLVLLLVTEEVGQPDPAVLPEA